MKNPSKSKMEQRSSRITSIFETELDEWKTGVFDENGRTNQNADMKTRFFVLNEPI